MIRRPPRSPLFPYTPLFRSRVRRLSVQLQREARNARGAGDRRDRLPALLEDLALFDVQLEVGRDPAETVGGDRKSTRLNSSHANISYAVFCLKKKKNLIKYT